MFRVHNLVFWVRFSTLPGPVVPGHGKVVKIRLKHFSTILIENDMNCTTNYVSMFRVQNGIIRARLSTLPAPVGLGLEKFIKIGPQQFSATLMTNDKNWTPISVGMFRVQNRVIRARLST